MGGGGVSTPPPSQAEQNLQQQQADLLQEQTGIIKQQAAMQNLLLPSILQGFGFNVTKDANGNITGVTQDPKAQQNAQLSDQVQHQQLQFESDALAGKLPINSAVEATLDRSETNLNNSFKNAFGPDSQTSTGYTQAFNDFLKYRTGIEQAAQRGDMTLGQQLVSAGAGSNASIAGFNSTGAGAVNSSFGGLTNSFNSASSGFTGAINPFLQQQQMGLSASAANAQINQSNMAGIGSLVGTVGMLAALAA